MAAVLNTAGIEVDLIGNATINVFLAKKAWTTLSSTLSDIAVIKR